MAAIEKWNVYLFTSPADTCGQDGPMNEELPVITTETIMECTFDANSICNQYCINKTAFTIGPTTAVNIAYIPPSRFRMLKENLLNLTNEEKLADFCDCVDIQGLNCTVEREECFKTCNLNTNSP